MSAVNGNATTRFTQLPLGVHLRETATFANYYPGVNGDVVRLLQRSITEGSEFIYLWGGHGSGKTHLLQAVCHMVSNHMHRLAYFPLREVAALPPGILEGVEQLPVVIVDDIDVIAGRAEWETSLFHLYNNVQERGGRMIMSGCDNPVSIGILLPDLRSRLAAGLVLRLRDLNDQEKTVALRFQARRRGMEMPEDVAGYLLRRFPRDMTALFSLLDVLDHATLAAQRKLTIPFVKEVLQ
jgi:DnaA-homolog protein